MKISEEHHSDHTQVEHGNITESLDQDQSTKMPWYRHSIVTVLIRGVILTLPLIIFVIAVYYLVKLIASMLSPFTMFLYPGSEEIPWYIHFVALLLLLCFFFVVGWAANKNTGYRLFKEFEQQFLSPIPLYDTIRDTVQQFTGIKKVPFRQAVLVDPYDTGIMLTGFITEKIRHDLYTVFVPTAPNPVNGNIYHVPRSRLIFLSVGADAAMRSIVGMGTGSSFLFTQDIIDQVRDHGKAEVNEDPL